VLVTFSHGKLLYQGFGCKLLQGCWKIIKHVCFQVVVEGSSFCSKTSGFFQYREEEVAAIDVASFFLCCLQNTNLVSQLHEAFF
jgi:hypothetical protein